ncbi:co-chaperone YbbN [Propionibacteriaceae bacterium G57]|uniref:co-chaperone YbbN n=1 Tax=Aestuariimicrobium sp. G57 TaxID=3418485 RepID=UPI003DA6E649
MSHAANPGSSRGAVDLSGFQSSSQDPGSPNGLLDGHGAATPPAGGAATGASWVVEVTEAGFNDFVQQSVSYPVVLELYSPRDPQGAEVSRTLADHTNANQGRWLLGRVNVDTEPRVAEALQATSVPYVLVLLAGRAAPLFQGTRPASEITAALDQVAEVALANGLTNRAPAQAPAASAHDAEAEPAIDPRYAPAYDAMERGEYAAAAEEFDKVLAQAPNDQEATAGKAQASLLARSLEFVPTKVIADAAARPDDVEAQFAAADLEVIQGETAAAFDRLIGLIRDLRGDDREPVRVRVLELFATQPAGDPVVARARRALSSALFA